MNEFKINNNLTLKLENGDINIYIGKKYFIQCTRLILEIPKKELKAYNNIESIDEAAEVYDHYVHEHHVLKDNGLPEVENDEDFSLIEPEEEFWGHCSNLQVWSEHDYDTRLLKANLAFPLLEGLAKAGDKLAQIKFKEEILKRLLSGSESVIEYLFVESYLDYLSNEELLTGLLEANEADLLMAIQRKLNVVFKFVPSIDRGIGFKPPVNTKEIKRIRKFSIENKRVKGLELKFSEVPKLPIKAYSLKRLKQIRMYGNFSELNSNEIIKTIQKLKGIEEIFLSSSLVKDLDNTILKDIKKIGKKISRLYGFQYYY